MRKLPVILVGLAWALSAGAQPTDNPPPAGSMVFQCVNNSGIPAAVSGKPYYIQCTAGGSLVTSPGGGIPAPAVQFDFVHNPSSASALTVTRTANNGATDLLPTSPSTPVGSIHTFADNTPRTTAGLGLLVERAATNFLRSSTAPATQTISVGAGNPYILWVNGSGSVTVAPGTGVGCTGTATQGSPLVFTQTTGGTCVFTVTGTLNAFQLESSSLSPPQPSSLIITGASASQARTADIIILPSFTAMGTNYSLAASAFFFSPPSLNSNQQTISVDDGGTTNRTQLGRFNATGDEYMQSVVAGASVGTTDMGVPTPAMTWARTVGTVSPTSQSASSNGGTPVTTALTGATPGSTFTRMVVGSSSSNPGTAALCICYIGGIQLWPNLLMTLTQLQVQSGNHFGTPP